MSAPSNSGSLPSFASTGEKFAASLAQDEALSADMLIIDDMVAYLDQRHRDTFWETLVTYISRNIPVIISLASMDMLSSRDIGLLQSMLGNAQFITLDFRSAARVQVSDSEDISVMRAAAQLQALEPDTLPKQADMTTRFAYSGTGPIEIAPEPAPIVTAEKLELYEELCLKVRNLLAACPREANRTGRLRSSAESLAEFLPRDIADVQPRRLWSRANTLRRYRDADLRLRRSDDLEELPLPEIAAELLSDLVEQFNVFAMHDEVLRQLDNGSLGPRDRAEVLLELEAGRVLSRAITETPRIAEPSAAKVLAEATLQANDAATQLGINADQALNQALETQRNGAIALLTKALNEVKARLKSVEDGGWKYVGSESAKFLFTNFVRLYESQISSLLGRSQGADVVTYVLRLIHRLLG